MWAAGRFRPPGPLLPLRWRVWWPPCGPRPWRKRQTRFGARPQPFSTLQAAAWRPRTWRCRTRAARWSPTSCSRWLTRKRCGRPPRVVPSTSGCSRGPSACCRWPGSWTVAPTPCNAVQRSACLPPLPSPRLCAREAHAFLPSECSRTCGASETTTSWSPWWSRVGGHRCGCVLLPASLSLTAPPALAPCGLAGAVPAIHALAREGTRKASPGRDAARDAFGYIKVRSPLCCPQLGHRSRSARGGTGRAAWRLPLPSPSLAGHGGEPQAAGQHCCRLHSRAWHESLPYPTAVRSVTTRGGTAPRARGALQVSSSSRDVCLEFAGSESPSSALFAVAGMATDEGGAGRAAAVPCFRALLPLARSLAPRGTQRVLPPLQRARAPRAHQPRFPDALRRAAAPGTGSALDAIDAEATQHEDLFNNKTSSDIKLMVGPDATPLHAHKAVLRAASPGLAAVVDRAEKEGLRCAARAFRPHRRPQPKHATPAPSALQRMTGRRPCSCSCASCTGPTGPSLRCAWCAMGVAAGGRAIAQ